MSHNQWTHLLHGAHSASKAGNHKTAGVMYVVIGFFMAPLLIGIPIMLYGFYKLLK